MKKICVLGSGAWGTVMGSLLADKGYDVIIYGVEETQVNEINSTHTNKRFLGENFKVNNKVIATLNFDFAVLDADVIIVAVPSFAVRETVEKLKNKLKSDVLIVNLAKGFDKETKQTLGELIRNVLPENLRGNVVSLLGPTFAEEVAEKQYTAITATARDSKYSTLAQKIFSNEYFRVYTNDDYVGAEYCSSLKNVIALAAGIADGLGFKVNTRAMLITRGMAEIKRYVEFLGGKEQTCFGLAGVGDLFLTCSSKTSRNYSAGYKIGSTSYAEFERENQKTVEGIFAVEIAYEIAKQNDIYSPIIEAVYNVVKKGANPRLEIKKLMTNQLKSEQ